MSAERPTLAEALRDAIDWDFIEVYKGEPGEDDPYNGDYRRLCETVAAAAERWFLDRLADETLVEDAAGSLGQWGDWDAQMHAVRAALAQVAEAVRDA